ncbi:low affinity iron permease family protein [Pseudomonas sp. Marseille-Q0931]|uniref:low affinity iron permease family protein n=1 Tax=Pseudomonas sp. Marseille-Q0931 TaxID=2697507 RepID=UPI0023B99100|nr:low affinity iron permease family protein [Pseudomonas sp. Marseille-Q0931]
MTFTQFAQVLSRWSGDHRIFLVAILLLLVWAGSGPFFHFNDTWQLIINTTTTIITFLMVFLIQNTQNRDNDVLHIKLDELLRTTKDAHNALLNLDELSAGELRSLRKHYAALFSEDGPKGARINKLLDELSRAGDDSEGKADAENESKDNEQPQ